jgi:hypothetical protein
MKVIKIAGKVLIFCFAACFVYLCSYASEKILFHAENEYGPVWIHESRGVRCLSFAKPETTNVRQSCIILEILQDLCLTILKWFWEACI